MWVAEPGGWSRPTRCCVGTGAASSGTGPNHSDRRADRRPRQSFADSHCASQLRIRLGATAASTANSPGSATRSLRPRSGRSSRTPESTRHPLAAKSLGRSSCGPRPPSPATSPPSTPSRCAGSTCCSSSTSGPGPCTSHRSRTTPAACGPGQAARNLFLRHADGLAGTRALVRDRGNQFIDAFDEIFRTERMKILKTPVRTPVANRVRRTLDRHLSTRTPRPHHHLEPSPAQQACRRLHRSLQHAPAPPFARSATTRRHRPFRPAR